jgi:hypothetical protein
MIQYALGFQTVNFRIIVALREKILFWEARESKKNAATARFHLFFHLDFPEKGLNRTWSCVYVIFSSQ